MTKTQKQLFVLGFVTLAVCVVGYLAWDSSQRNGSTRMCQDGPHGKIDLRDFSTRYSQWSFTFEAEIQSRGKIAAGLNEKQIQQLSEAILQANQFRQYVVAGFNACAITSIQFAQYGAALQAIDSMERQIHQLVIQASRNEKDSSQLDKLILEVVAASEKLRQ